MSTNSRQACASPSGGTGADFQARLAGRRRRLRRSVLLTAVLYAATITALTLLPGWVMSR